MRLAQKVLPSSRTLMRFLFFWFFLSRTRSRDPTALLEYCYHNEEPGCGIGTAAYVLLAQSCSAQSL